MEILISSFIVCWCSVFSARHFFCSVEIAHADGCQIVKIK